MDLVLVAPPLAAVAFTAADQTARFADGLEGILDQVQERDRLGVLLAALPPRRLQHLWR